MVGVSSLDIVFLIIIGASAVGGLRRGFVLGTVDLLLFAAALVLGIKLAPLLADSIQSRGIPHPVNGAIAFFIMAVASYAILGLVARILLSPLKILHVGTIGWFNSVLGLIPGALRGTAIAALVSFAFLALPAEFGSSRLTLESRFARPLATTGQELVQTGLDLASVDPASLGFTDNPFLPVPSR